MVSFVDTDELAFISTRTGPEIISSVISDFTHENEAIAATAHIENFVIAFIFQEIRKGNHLPYHQSQD